MSGEAWEWIVALGFGSAVGVGIRRGLTLLFGEAGKAISVSTITVSSILGGFSGAAIGYVMASSGLPTGFQTLVMFALIGLMATVAADATAAQAALGPEDAARMRRRFGVHVAIGAGAAAIGVGVAVLIRNIFS